VEVRGAHRPASALAVVSVLLGLAALVTGPLVLGAVPAIAGLACARLHLRSGRRARGLAWWGASLSGLGLVLSLAAGAAYYRWSEQVKALSKDGGIENA